jgi:hypothetical protein
MIIGAKRGGTWKQYSQELFELAEIFRKFIKIIKKLKICLMYNEERFLDEVKISQIFHIQNIFSYMYYVAFCLSPRIIKFITESNPQEH